LTVVIDRNRLQSLGKTEETVPLEPLSDKWLAFNWEVQTIDGHDFNELRKITDHKSQTNARVFIANTVKGKGVTFMENSVLWHYRPPNLDELELAKKEVS
jgi:transketolase